MKKIIFLFILLLLLILTDFASTGKMAVLPDILKPDSITVDNNQVIVTERTSIYLYSIKDFSLQKKFGKQGEGPQEFKITSYGGTGLGSTMVGNRNYMTVNIYDAGLNKIKEVCKWESPYRSGEGTRVFTEPYVLHSYGDKIFTTDGVEFEIDVYDNDGKKMYTIKQEYKKIKVSEETEKAVIHYFKTSPSTRDVFQFMQPIKFPEYLPAIRNFIVKDQKIYVLNFKQEDNKSEFYVFDLKGKLLKHVFLPLKEQTALTYFPYTIKDDTLYQLVENEDEEEWELVVTEI